MGTLGTRLKELRRQRKLTQGQLGKAVGVSDVTIGYWERDFNVPGGKSLANLARYFGVSEGFLLYGREDEPNIVSSLIAAQQVPIISYVQAGVWTPECDARNLEGTVDYILTSEFHSHSTFALKVKGKSMEPEFVEGDVIIVDPELHAGPGDYVVAKNGGDEATFKKYRARGITDSGEEIFELVPLNEDYAIRNSAKENIHIVGVVVEHRRIMRRK